MKTITEQTAGTGQAIGVHDTGELRETMKQIIALLKELKGNVNLDSLDNKRTLAVFLRCSTRQVENLVKAGKIPPAIYISDSSPRWRRSSVLAWLDRLAAATGEV